MTTALEKTAIEVEGLSKTYRVWPRPSDMALEMLTFRKRHIQFQALNDVSFDVAPGSVTGILGRNGAGKSTLLRIIAGTLDASAGRIKVNGRVSAILELGTGFSPEYTGRENVYLGGLCLGLTRREIDQRFDEIVDFAELGEFIDRPFRTFSSGMKARLTFSVATCVDPDILIIDEALAVGDARFQIKSFERVRDFKRRGKSILLVSHDMNQIASICDRTILLERGAVLADGDPQDVCNLYQEMLFSTASAERQKKADMVSVRGASSAESPTEYRYGDGAAHILDMRLTTRDGVPVTTFKSLETYVLTSRIRANRPLADLNLGILFRDRRGLDLFGWDLQTAGLQPLQLAEGEETEVKVEWRANLGPTEFFLTVALAGWGGEKYDVRYNALSIMVMQATGLYTTSLINLEPKLVSATIQI